MLVLHWRAGRILFHNRQIPGSQRDLGSSSHRLAVQQIDSIGICVAATSSKLCIRSGKKGCHTRHRRG